MIIKQNIIDKVNTLREERNMMSYCDAWHMSPETEKLTKKIITMIQYNIFDIDDVCEKNLLPADHLQLLIDDAKQDILAQVSIALEDSERAVLYTQRLFDFYQMEMNMRQVRENPILKSPLDYAIEEFYILKSCDVFLSRKIVTVLAANEDLYTDLVLIFDQLGEVLDDLMDVEEDIEAINSNRFLISLVKKWVAETMEEYFNFIRPNLKILLDNNEELHSLWLNVTWLKKQLDDYLSRDWSWVKYSKTNELLFGK